MKQENTLMTILTAFITTLSVVAQINDIDGNSYKIISIGGPYWIVENLKVSHFNNGDPIPEVKSNNDWEMAGEGGKPAWCYYNNNPLNGKKYGKLYNWYAIMDPRGLAPQGWHLPNNKEWEELIDDLNEANVEVAGTKMKTTYGWNSGQGVDNGNGTNKSGFSALPGGLRSWEGHFAGIGDASYWWSTDGGQAYVDFYMVRFETSAVERGRSIKHYGFYVRCLRDP